ncbi:MAG: DUF167 domain-containing protein [Thermoflavifilum sp.]|nr:DUF167 domain-containing protein [Thermoflavifilum sp.]
MSKTILTVRVHASARQKRYVWIDEKKLKMDICAPREKGKANAALIADLANYLQISRQDIQILSGHHASVKLVSIALPLADIHKLMP